MAWLAAAIEAEGAATAAGSGTAGAWAAPAGMEATGGAAYGSVPGSAIAPEAMNASSTPMLQKMLSGAPSTMGMPSVAPLNMASNSGSSYLVPKKKIRKLF